MVNSYVSLAKVYNSIFWNNDCDQTFWDPNTGGYKKFKDFYEVMVNSAVTISIALLVISTASSLAS